MICDADQNSWRVPLPEKHLHRRLARCQLLEEGSLIDGGAFGASVVGVGELHVVQTKQVQDAGVQIVDVQPVFDRSQAEFVG